MKVSRSLPLIILITIISSCATTRDKQKVVEKVAPKLTAEEAHQIAIERVGNRFKELTKAAMTAGPDKVRFLASDMYLKASAALMESDFQTANIIFEHLIPLTPNDDYVKEKYAISLIRTGELEKAKDLLVTVYVNSKKKKAKLGLILAGVYSGMGEIEKSRLVYKGILKQDPKQEEACIFLSKSYAVEKKISKAVKLLKKCEKRNPKHGVYSYYIGKIYVEQKKYKTALSYFQRSQRREADFTEAILGEGLIFEQLEKPKKAKTVYKKYLVKKPNDKMVLSRLVQLMFTQENYKEVVDYAQRLSDLEPDNLNLKVKLGILYKDAGKFSQAITTFKELLEVAPDSENILYYLGAIYQERKDYESAIGFFAKVDTASALYQDSSLQIAQMLSLLALEHNTIPVKKVTYQKRFLDYMKKIRKEIPEFKIEFSVIEATYYEGVGEINQAISSLESVREESLFGIDHNFYLASLYEKENRFAASSKIVESILKADPKNAHAWNFLGYSLLEQGDDLAKAYKYISKAIEISPNDGYIRDSLGWYYFKVGDNERALKELKAAIKLVPGDTSINKHIALTYGAMKKFAQAKSYARRALAVAENDKERTELNEMLKSLEQERIPATVKKN